jgi:hypothetical protein
MSSLWDAVFIHVLDRTGPLMLNLSDTPYKTFNLEDMWCETPKTLIGSR